MGFISQMLYLQYGEQKPYNIRKESSISRPLMELYKVS